MFYEAYEKSETAKLFHQTADTQRGPPEAAMLAIQSLMGGGVFPHVAEHVGDITHRMAENFDHGKGQLDLVGDKVEKTLRTLESGYGFEKEMQENFESNFRFLKEHGRMPFDTVEQFEGQARFLSLQYAHEHSKVPVFNEPQMHAREAAVELGKWNFEGAIAHLRWLKELCDDEERYYHEVAQVTMKEGADNGFYLTQLTGRGPTIYPLPTGAKEYENIDSPKRGGADVDVREDAGEWYHGTPEIQKLGKEFENRTQSIDYLTDPEKWIQVQQKLEEVDWASDEYFELLDIASSLRAYKKVRSPVFLSNKHEVANTYADDRRAFDYQSAVPGVTTVQVGKGKTLTINGAGQDFRGITVDSVRDGLRKTGIDDATIEHTLAQFTHQIRGDGGTLSTHALAAVVDELGFDIIDVLRIKDTYMGGGPPATVRMVMDPSLIRINRQQGGTNNIKEWEDENGASFSDDTLMKSGWVNPTTGENLDSVYPTNYDHRSVWLKHKGQDVPVHQFDNIYNQGFVRYYVVGDNEMGHVVLSGNEKDIRSAGFNKFLSTFPLHANYELTVNDKALGKLNET